MISDRAELLSSLDAGLEVRLATPCAPNHATLGVAMGLSCGASIGHLLDYENASVARDLMREIGYPEHLVFVMLDGFGMNFVGTLPEMSYVRRNLRLEMSAVFPTSTGPNLISIATGRWPGAHGNVGWHVFIPRFGERITSLLWQRTSDGGNLSEIGFAPQELLLAPMIEFGHKRQYTHITEVGLAGSPWTAITSQDQTLGYDHGDGAIGQVVEHVRGVLANAGGPTFTYIYWPDVDHTAHELGVTHPMTRRAVLSANALIEALGTEFAGQATVVATADHGHLDVGEDGYDVIPMDDPLRDLLVGSPGGEQRIMFFHPRPGDLEGFADEFQTRFGARYSLVESSDAIDFGLMGPPQRVSAVSRERLGDYIAISRGRWAMSFPDDPASPGVMASTHGGITDSETRVPLIVSG